MSMLAGIAGVWTVVAGTLSCIVARQNRELIGGALVALLIGAVLISGSYVIIAHIPAGPAADVDCAGPPYEVC